LRFQYCGAEWLRGFVRPAGHEFAPDYFDNTLGFALATAEILWRRALTEALSSYMMGAEDIHDFRAFYFIKCGFMV
jgi:hypothetical protein